MDTITRLIEISSRLEQIENSAEWIAKETIHNDNTLSQSGTLICVLADDLRERIYQLVKQLEEAGDEVELLH